LCLQADRQDGNGDDDDVDPDNMTYEVCGYGMFFFSSSFQVTCKACEQNRTMQVVCTFTPGLEFGKATDFLPFFR